MSLTFDYASAFREVFGNLIGTELDIQITRLRKNRSNRQNRYLHGVVVPVVQSFYKDTTGLDHLHDAIYVKLRKDLGDQVKIEEIDGQEVITMTGKRFSKMDTKEFAQAVDQLIKIYAEKGCDIPEPNEECFINDFINDKK